MTDLQRLKECCTCYHDPESCGIEDKDENEDGSCPKYVKSDFYSLMWQVCVRGEQ